MANVLENSVEEVGNASSDAAAGLIGYCSDYSYTLLIAAVAFLAAGLVFVTAAAYFEGRKARAEALRVEADARKAAAEADKAEGRDTKRVAEKFEVPVTVVTTFVKSFAAVLGDAKAWVAMILIGLLLAWMAGNAPNLCKSGFVLTGAEANESAEDDEADPAANASGNGVGNATDPADGNGAGAAQAPANTAAPSATKGAAPRR